MAPRSRLLDLETQDVLFFYGDLVGVATYTIVFWPVLLAATLLLRLIAPLLPQAAAVCAGLYVAYRFLLHRAARSPSSSAGSPAAPPSHTSSLRMMAGYMIGQNP